MEIRNWNWYIVINCAFLPFLAAKTFSLNEALAAESKLKSSHISSSFSTEPAPQRFSLNKNFATENPKKIKFTENPKKTKFEKLLHEKLSPLKHSKSHQIKSPSKSKKARNFLKPFSSRRSFTKKRDTPKNDKKYFPILKNLGELLNNLLNSEPIESNEITNTKQKRKYQSEAKRGIVCKCALQSDTDTGETRAYKKTAVLAETIPAKSAATSPPTPHSTPGDVSGIRQNKDLSLLLPRDPPSDRRDGHGLGEGSRPTFHGSFERNLPGDFRTSKHYTGFREEESDTQGHEKVTYSHTRDYASSDEYGRRQNRGNRNIPIGRRANKRKTFEEDYKTNRIFERDSIEEHSRENQFKVRRNQTKSEKFIPEHVRRLRRPVSEVEDGDIAESIPSKEYYEKSVNYVSFDNTSDKRISSGSGPSTTEAKETSATNEDMISLKDLSNLKLALHKSPQKMETPSVTIIDGYSVARDKNGQNKLSEKTIHIHT